MNAYRCQCEHLHGADACEAVVGHEAGTNEPIRCRCSRFRQSVSHDGNRRIDQGGSAFTSPLYHLSAYGLKNPWVGWCIANGVYVDMENRGATGQDIGTLESRQLAMRLKIPVSPINQLRR